MSNQNSCHRLTVGEALERLPGPQGQSFVTLFEHGSLSVELYARRGSDPQTPHSRDEIYVVAQGSGEFVCGGTRQTFGPNDVLFAAARVEHRFENFSDERAKRCRIPESPMLLSRTPKAKSPPHRCHWAKTDLAIAYHDREWGVPLHDERGLFEFLILEGVQAGLSWEIILRKRDNYRAAFDNFDPRKVAKYDQRRVAKLLNNAGIIRNRLKISSAIQNAKAFLKTQKEFGSFDAYVWRFVNGKTIKRKRGEGVEAFTPQSDVLSRDLLARGFKFVGSTICYSFMQAVGMVNDHESKCFRYSEVSRMTGH